MGNDTPGRIAICQNPVERPASNCRQQRAREHPSISGTVRSSPLGSVCFDRLVADPAREGHFKFINDEDGHAIFLPESAFFMKDGASTGLIEAFCPDGLTERVLSRWAEAPAGDGRG